MARILSKLNPKRLILPARNKVKGSNLLEYIKSNNGNVDNVEVWEMDLADLQSVKNFANKFINEIGELHILINNAGIKKKKLKMKIN
jgi:short-subunit dehydrogenase